MARPSSRASSVSSVDESDLWRPPSTDPSGPLHSDDTYRLAWSAGVPAPSVVFASDDELSVKAASGSFSSVAFGLRFPVASFYWALVCSPPECLAEHVGVAPAPFKDALPDALSREAPALPRSFLSPADLRRRMLPWLLEETRAGIASGLSRGGSLSSLSVPLRAVSASVVQHTSGVFSPTGESTDLAFAQVIVHLKKLASTKQLSPNDVGVLLLQRNAIPLPEGSPGSPKSVTSGASNSRIPIPVTMQEVLSSDVACLAILESVGDETAEESLTAPQQQQQQQPNAASSSGGGKAVVARLLTRPPRRSESGSAQVHRVIDGFLLSLCKGGSAVSVQRSDGPPLKVNKATHSLRFLPLDSLTTSTREFSSLCSFHVTPFASAIATPVPTPPLPPTVPPEWFQLPPPGPRIAVAATSERGRELAERVARSGLPPTAQVLSEPLAVAIAERLNHAQANAVLRCVADRSSPRSPRVHLIHGPPGTGKTKTIASLIAAFLGGHRVLGGQAIQRPSSATDCRVTPRPASATRPGSATGIPITPGAALQALRDAKERLRNQPPEPVKRGRSPPHASSPPAKRSLPRADSDTESAAGLSSSDDEDSRVRPLRSDARAPVKLLSVPRQPSQAVRASQSDEDAIIVLDDSSDDDLDAENEEGDQEDAEIVLDDDDDDAADESVNGTSTVAAREKPVLAFDSAPSLRGSVKLPPLASLGIGVPRSRPGSAQLQNGLATALDASRRRAERQKEPVRETKAMLDSEAQKITSQRVRALPPPSAPPRPQPVVTQHAPLFCGRILVCAPSNAAVDEIVSRLVGKRSEPLPTRQGIAASPRVVRLGKEEAVRPDVRPWMLATQAKRLMASTASPLGGEPVDSLKEALHRAKSEAGSLRGRGGGKDADEATQKRLERLDAQIASLERRILRSTTPKHVRSQAMSFQEACDTLIQSAHVVATTLSTSAGSQNTRGRGRALAGPVRSQVASLAASFTWDAIIIDEACQATLVSSLVALTASIVSREAGRAAGSPPTLILVGDPQQLPPTIVSRRAARAGLSQSLFERLLATVADPDARGVVSLPPKLTWRPTSLGGYFLLDTQYRMHPAIRAFPSKQFYLDRILDGVPIDIDPGRGVDSIVSRPQPYFRCQVFSPVRFISCAPSVSKASAVYENLAEARIISRLVAELLRVAMLVPWKSGKSASCDLRGKIGIITPYQMQTKLVRRLLREELKLSVDHELDDYATVSTVDGFQGQEKDVIFLSCVRTKNIRGGRGGGGGGGIGFVKDRRRLNVALTRAKHSLVIVGDSDWLASHDKTWAALIDDLTRRRQLWSINNAIHAAQIANQPKEDVWTTQSVWKAVGSLLRGYVTE
jgi:hypothetical protein